MKSLETQYGDIISYTGIRFKWKHLSEKLLIFHNHLCLFLKLKTNYSTVQIFLYILSKHPTVNNGALMANTHTALLKLFSLPFFWRWAQVYEVKLAYASSIKEAVVYVPSVSHHKVSVVNRIMAPKDVYILNPWTCDYVTLHGKGTLQMWLRLRTLRRGNYLGLLKWSH